MTLDEACAHIGDAVIYHPYAPDLDPVEEGVITSVNDSFAWVRYGADKVNKATAPDRLTLAAAATESAAEDALTPESPAGTMRRAAKLMRDRAALVPPPPWFPAVHDVTTYDDLDVIASSGLTVRAQYVASMHPGFALAVADLLDKWAWMGEMDPDLLGRVGGGEAIAVARAYLGEPDDHRP